MPQATGIWLTKTLQLTYRKIETKIMKMKSKYFSLLLLLLVTLSSCTNAQTTQR
jgi:hypothetical protein